MTTSLVELSNNLADAVDRAGKSVIAVQDGGRDGVSGTLWRAGLAVTAEHTIRGLDEVSIVLPGGQQTKAAVAGRDPGTDIAVLNVPGTSNSAALADEALARVGEIVLAVGRRGTDGLASTYGVISAMGGPWRTWQGARVDHFFRLDLNPFTGFSGGPIVNARGEVLGMATSGPRRSVLTIPAATVTRAVDQIAQRGRVPRGYLGIGVQLIALPEATQQALSVSAERALLVVNVAAGSSAERSGVLVGDMIVSVNGSPVRSVQSLQPALDPENVGKTVAVEIARAGKLLKLPVAVGERAGS